MKLMINKVQYLKHKSKQRSSLFVAMCLLVLVSPSYSQVLGTEAYLYGDIPIPAHIIADDFIERVVLPKLNVQELRPLWLTVKSTPLPVDKTIDKYFKTRAKPSDEQRQLYLSRLMLLTQLREAIIVYEQLPLTPNAYAAHFGDYGFPPPSQEANYLAKAATFAKAGDQPQKAALKAAVALIHEQDRRDGAPVFECYFENPETRQQAFCTQLIGQIDGMYRDTVFAKRYPIDDQSVKRLAQYTRSSKEMIRNRSTIIDTIQLMLRGIVPPPAEGFRLHRNAAIRNALEHRDEYRAALQKRESHLPPAPRPAAEQDPLAGFVSGMLAAAVGMAMYAETLRTDRARRNAANPTWKGHENDEWCVPMKRTLTQGLSDISIEFYAYCTSYTGHQRVAEDRCRYVKGWCPER